MGIENIDVLKELERVKLEKENSVLKSEEVSDQETGKKEKEEAFQEVIGRVVDLMGRPDGFNEVLLKKIEKAGVKGEYLSADFYSAVSGCNERISELESELDVLEKGAIEKLESGIRFLKERMAGDSEMESLLGRAEAELEKYQSEFLEKSQKKEGIINEREEIERCREIVQQIKEEAEKDRLAFVVKAVLEEVAENGDQTFLFPEGEILTAVQKEIADRNSVDERKKEKEKREQRESLEREQKRIREDFLENFVTGLRRLENQFEGFSSRLDSNIEDARAKVINLKSAIEKDDKSSISHFFSREKKEQAVVRRQNYPGEIDTILSSFDKTYMDFRNEMARFFWDNFSKSGQGYFLIEDGSSTHFTPEEEKRIESFKKRYESFIEEIDRERFGKLIPKIKELREFSDINKK